MFSVKAYSWSQCSCMNTDTHPFKVFIINSRLHKLLGSATVFSRQLDKGHDVQPPISISMLPIRVVTCICALQANDKCTIHPPTTSPGLFQWWRRHRWWIANPRILLDICEHTRQIQVSGQESKEDICEKKTGGWTQQIILFYL